MNFYATVPSTAGMNLPIGTAAEVGDLVYLSGFVHLDPANPDIPFEEAATKTIGIIEGVLGDLGLSLDHVFKVSAFLGDWANFPAWNALFAEKFSVPRPLRTTVVLSLAAGAQIEVEVIATKTTRADSAAA